MIVKTWKQIKDMIKKAGVKDKDFIFMLDIGPNCNEIFVQRTLLCKDVIAIEIADDPVLVKEQLE